MDSNVGNEHTTSKEIVRAFAKIISKNLKSITIKLADFV